MANGSIWICLFSAAIQTVLASLELVDIKSSNVASTQKTQSDSWASPEIDREHSTLNSTVSKLAENIVEYNPANGRSVSLTEPLPTSIEVMPDSVLNVQFGQAVINFKVTNNRFSPISYTFDARTEEGRPLRLTPRRSYISPGSATIIRVSVSTEDIGRGGGQANSNIITFTAQWTVLPPIREERVETKVYVTSGYQSPDSTVPDIYWTYSGDCSRFLEPHNCATKFWRADISIRDSESGLLMIKSFPVGLILNKEFIAGSKDEITGYYRASCCQTKVDIIARNTYGNERTVNIDIEKIWLSTWAIVAIVLASVLLFVIIILIVVCIVRFCRRRRSLSIYPDTRP